MLQVINKPWVKGGGGGVGVGGRLESKVEWPNNICLSHLDLYKQPL